MQPWLGLLGVAWFIPGARARSRARSRARYRTLILSVVDKNRKIGQRARQEKLTESAAFQPF